MTRPLANCRTCTHAIGVGTGCAARDEGDSRAAAEAIDRWLDSTGPCDDVDEWGLELPPKDADGCPGWSEKPAAVTP